MSDDNYYDICIIGAGIGGLSAAISLLQNKVCKILLVERDCHFSDRKQGYGLTITNSATGPLAKMNLIDECIKKNCLSKSHYIFDSNGDILGYYGKILKTNEENKKISGGNRGNLRIPRQELRQIMINKLNELNKYNKENNINSYCDFIWNKKFINYIENDDEVILTFQEINNKDKDHIEYINIKCSVLIGADGLRSKVRELRDQYCLNNKLIKKISPLKYLGISVIIGISSTSNPLLQNKGYYALDGKHRLFTMPFYTPGENDYNSTLVYQEKQQNKVINNANIEKEYVPTNFDEIKNQPQIMWQLSFSGNTEEESLKLKNSTSKEMIQNALDRVSTWFPAVSDLINSTLPGEVWTTPLYDRDPMEQFSKNGGSRVSFLGDACHPMSMFKGQGANQALEDGPLLAKWITLLPTKRNTNNNGETSKKNNNEDSNINSNNTETPEIIEENNHVSLKNIPKSIIFTRLRSFEREMIARTTSKVLGSRNSALLLHSNEALNEFFGISGIDIEDDCKKFLIYCKEKKINANDGELLDEKFQNLADEYFNKKN